MKTLDVKRLHIDTTPDTLIAMEDEVDRLVAAWRRERPDLVFYVSGADPYEGDRLGRLKLTIDGLAARDRLVFDACREHSTPVVVTMAGGYAHDVDAIVTIHANTVREARAMTGHSAEFPRAERIAGG